MKNLLKSNKIRVIASVLIAVCLWVAVNFSPSNEMTVTISDIPITVDLPEQAVANDLQVFQGGDITATVEVTGNRLTIGSLTKSDIQVYAEQTNTVTTSGTYTLALAAKKANSAKTGFEITDLVTPSVITIVVDRNVSTEMPITNNLRFQVAQGYYTSVSFSDEKVVVSGPESKVDQVAKVAVDYEISDELTSTTTLENLPLVLCDKNGNVIENDSISLSVAEISATVLVLAEKNFPIEFDFPNMPLGMDITDYITSANPEEVLVAGPQDTIDSLKYITAEGPDFTTLKNETVNLELPVEMPTDCRNLSNQTIANITLDLSSMGYVDFIVDNFDVIGESSEYSASVSTKSLQVRIYGPQEQLDALSSASVTAEISIDPQINGTGSMELPVNIKFSGSDNLCWQYGSYTANVTISEK